MRFLNSSFFLCPGSLCSDTKNAFSLQWFCTISLFLIRCKHLKIVGFFFFGSLRIIWKPCLMNLWFAQSKKMNIALWRFSFANYKHAVPPTCTHTCTCTVVSYRKEKTLAGRRKSRSRIKTGKLKKAPRGSSPHQWDAFLSFPQFSIEWLHCSHELVYWLI